MDNILLMVDNHQADLIANGNKRYHFSKSMINAKSKSALICVKYPINMVIGSCDIVDIIRNTPSNIWSLTSTLSGITQDRFISMFRGSSIAVAYELKNIKIYKKPKKIQDCRFSAIL